MSGPRGFPRRWFCSGCGKDHPLTRWIEATDGPRRWCGHSVKKAIRERRNDIPPLVGEFQDYAARFSCALAR